MTSESSSLVDAGGVGFCGRTESWHALLSLFLRVVCKPLIEEQLSDPEQRRVFRLIENYRVRSKIVGFADVDSENGDKPLRLDKKIAETSGVFTLLMPVEEKVSTILFAYICLNGHCVLWREGVYTIRGGEQGK